LSLMLTFTMTACMFGLLKEKLLPLTILTLQP
jgi:hypothetical protein